MAGSPYMQLLFGRRKAKQRAASVSGQVGRYPTASTRGSSVHHFTITTTYLRGHRRTLPSDADELRMRRRANGPGLDGSCVVSSGARSQARIPSNRHSSVARLTPGSGRNKQRRALSLRPQEPFSPGPLKALRRKENSRVPAASSGSARDRSPARGGWRRSSSAWLH
jgi:hypothetical protein